MTATLGGSATRPGATDVVVSVGGGTATSGTDYAAVSDFTVTIPQETASGTGTFTLTPTQDAIAEGDETIDVTGAADGFTVTKAQMTLTDDETAPASITLTVSPLRLGRTTAQRRSPSPPPWAAARRGPARPMWWCRWAAAPPLRARTTRRCRTSR